jgi:hypothetical protein
VLKASRYEPYACAEPIDPATMATANKVLKSILFFIHFLLNLPIIMMSLEIACRCRPDFIKILLSKNEKTMKAGLTIVHL